MGFHAGMLGRHRVTVLDQGPEVRSDVGQPVRAWVDREGRNACVEDLSAHMTYMAAMAGSRATTKVTLSAPLDIRPIVNALRFVYRGRTRILVVVEVRDGASPDYLEAYCTEVA